MSPLEVETTSRRVDGMRLTFVTVTGAVDLANAEQFQAALEPHRFADSEGVVLDLQLVPFMDSSGLAGVLGASEDLGSRLSIVIALDSGVQRLFEMTSTLDRATVSFSEEEALAALTRDGDAP